MLLYGYIIAKQVRDRTAADGVLAQLGEHLPYKQRVTGSSPVGPISFKTFSKYYGEIAQLARAHGSYPWCRGFKSLSRYYLRSGSRRCFHFFCASSDERSHGKFTAVLARTWNFVWLYEEHRDNDRTKFWSMSCSRNPRR